MIGFLLELMYRRKPLGHKASLVLAESTGESYSLRGGTTPHQIPLLVKGFPPQQTHRQALQLSHSPNHSLRENLVGCHWSNVHHQPDLFSFSYLLPSIGSSPPDLTPLTALSQCHKTDWWLKQPLVQEQFRNMVKWLEGFHQQCWRKREFVYWSKSL